MENDVIYGEPQLMMDMEGMMALFGTIFLIISIVSVIAYVFYSYCWFLLAKKTNTENPWMAFVPVLNIYLMTVIGKRDGWELLLMFIPLINLVWIIILFNAISKRCGKGTLMTLALIFLGPFSIPYLAFTYPQESANNTPKTGGTPTQPIEM